MKREVLLVVAGVLLVMVSAVVRAEEKQEEQAIFERLPYNNPGLEVDLGVGLWAWPLPMDFDGDGDGKLDILINSKNAEFWRQVKTLPDGRVCFRNMGNLHTKNIEGHDVSPTVVDFNNDGIPDFIGGAEDGYLYYLRNPATGGGMAAARARSK